MRAPPTSGRDGALPKAAATTLNGWKMEGLFKIASQAAVSSEGMCWSADSIDVRRAVLFLLRSSPLLVTSEAKLVERLANSGYEFTGVLASYFCLAHTHTCVLIYPYVSMCIST